MIVTIDKKEVLNEVDMTTAYIGAKDTADGTTYEHISTREENHEKLNSFFAEGVKMFYGLCEIYLMDVEEEGQTLTVTLEMPENWNKKNESKMDELVMSYISTYIVSQWLMFVHRDEVNDYVSKTVSIGQLIKKTLAERVKPMRERKHVVELPSYLIEQHDETRNGVNVAVVEMKDDVWWKENIGGKLQVSDSDGTTVTISIGGKIRSSVGNVLDIKITDYTGDDYVFDGFTKTVEGYTKSQTVKAGDVIRIKVVKQEQ